MNNSNQDNAKNKLIQDAIEWDIVNWSKALYYWEEKINLENKQYECLELGGRRGGLSLWLASKGNSVICSDLENPYKTASGVHKNYSFASRISYDAIDSTNIPYTHYFDVIVFKSILGGVSRDGKTVLKQAMIDQIYNALKPGGVLLFAENLVASGLHQILRKKMMRWGSYWNYSTVDEMEKLFHQFKSLEFDTAGFLGAFGRSEYQKNMLAKLDTLLFDRIVSPKMHYIIFGIARK